MRSGSEFASNYRGGAIIETWGGGRPVTKALVHAYVELPSPRCTCNMSGTLILYLILRVNLMNNINHSEIH